MNTRKAIFFDFDGVIADSLHIAFAVNQLRYPTLALETYRSYFDQNINTVKHTLKPVRELDFDTEYASRFGGVDLDAQKLSIIQKLSEEFQLFIISGTITPTIKTYLARHGAEQYFTEIMGNEVHGSKVVRFGMLIDKYQLNPAEITFITDSGGDIREAQEAQLGKIVAITGGFQSREVLEKAHPHAIVDNFTEFYDLLHI